MSEPTASPSVPDPFIGLVDDAAIFPPGLAQLDRAVADYLSRRDESWSPLVGNFVIADHRLADLRPLLAGISGSGGGDSRQVPLAVVIGAGAGGISPAADQVRHLPGARLAAIEVALRDPDDLPANARRIVAALDQARDLGLIDDVVSTWVELPQGAPTRGWLAAADELAAAELGCKFRTGGVEAHLFPSVDELAAWIDAALDRETPFKCTAGLHHAIRHTDPSTGFTHHGFLNVLAATRTALDGGDIAATLSETDGAALVAGLPDADTLLRTRRWFTSLGSCSVLEPLDDLHALGLLEVTA